MQKENDMNFLLSDAKCPHSHSYIFIHDYIRFSAFVSLSRFGWKFEKFSTTDERLKTVRLRWYNQKYLLLSSIRMVICRSFYTKEHSHAQSHTRQMIKRFLFIWFFDYFSVCYFFVGSSYKKSFWRRCRKQSYQCGWCFRGVTIICQS